MSRNQKDFTFDFNLQLKDAGAVTTSAAAQVLAANKVLDLGAARLDARAIIDIDAIKTSVGDESYRIRLEVSNDATFATLIFEAAALELGATAATGDSAADPVGRHELAFTNEINGTAYRYARLYHLIAGTLPTITYRSFVVQEFA